jgi:hypothetical protein
MQLIDNDQVIAVFGRTALGAWDLDEYRSSWYGAVIVSLRDHPAGPYHAQRFVNDPVSLAALYGFGY